MKKTILTTLLLFAAAAAFADDLNQLFEKAYFLETAKGQTEEALEIYRRIAATPPSDEGREAVIKALDRLINHYTSQRFETIQEKIDHFDLQTAFQKDVIRMFGEPEGYTQLNKVLTDDDLPPYYSMSYPNNLVIHIVSHKVNRIDIREPIYTYKGITVGTSASDLLTKFPPSATISGEESERKDRVLYKAMPVLSADCMSYYVDGIKLFIQRGKVSSMTLYKEFRNSSRKNCAIKAE